MVKFPILLQNTIKIHKRINTQLNPISKKETEILLLLENKPNLTQKVLANSLNLSEQHTRKLIKQLKEKQLIKRIGSNKTGIWEIVDPKNTNSKNEQINKRINANSKKEEEILSLLRKNPNQTQIELASCLNLSEQHTRKLIKQLKDKQLIRRIGCNKTGSWKIVDPEKTNKGSKLLNKRINNEENDEQAIILLLKINPSLTNSELANKLECEEQYVRKLLKLLKSKHLIVRLWNNKTSYWHVKNNI